MTLTGADKIKDWDGEGLPPVGTVCEAQILPITDSHWSEAVIVAINGMYAWIKWEGMQEPTSTVLSTARFRPFRTEEDKAVGELVNIIELNAHSIKDTARAIIKAGYKK